MLTLIATEREDECVIKRYECDFIADCDGSSIWGDTTGRKVNVKGITVFEDSYDDYNSVSVTVEHDTTWDIYTDRGFERAISKALGFEVMFTEQGMQEDNFASMEA